MDTRVRHRRLMTAAAFVVVSAGLWLGKAVVLPVAMSVFVVVMASPFYTAMKHRGVPAWIARIVVMLVALAFVGVLALLCMGVIRGLSNRMTMYETQYAAFQAAFQHSVRRFPALVAQLASLIPAPSTLSGWLQTASQHMLTYLWPAWLLIFLVQDAMEESDAMGERLRSTFHNGARLADNWKQAAGYIRRFMAVRAVEGLVKAAAVWGLLRVLHVDFPTAWALLAFLAIFLPTPIGQPLALAPAAFMAMIGPGVVAMVVILVAYPLMDFAFDELFEPLISESTRISDYQGAVATFYWTLVLGPIGAFLAMPLTVMARALLASFDESRLAAVMMYSEPEPSLAEPRLTPRKEDR